VLWTHEGPPLCCGVQNGHGPDIAIPVDAPMTWKEKLYALFQKYRRRLATLVLMIFLAAVALEIFGAIPRETQVSLPLANHAAVVEARVEYSYEERAIHEVVYQYLPGRAPNALHHTLDLSPGDYSVRVELRDVGGGHRVLHGRLTAPADGEIRVHLR
jgi:hypothetical protein